MGHQQDEGIAASCTSSSSSAQNAGSAYPVAPETNACRVLAIVSAFQALAVAVLESLTIRDHVALAGSCVMTRTSIAVSQTDLLYCGLVLGLPIYQLFVCIDTLKQRNTTSLYAFVLLGNSKRKRQTNERHARLFIHFHSGLLTVIFVAINVYQDMLLSAWMLELDCPIVSDLDRRFKYATLGVTAVCFLVTAGCCTQIHRSLRRSTATETLAALIRLDMYFVFSLAMQMLPSELMRYDSTVLEAVLLAAVAAVFFVMLWYAARFPMLLSLLVACAALSVGYFAFRATTFALAHPIHQDPYRVCLSLCVCSPIQTSALTVFLDDPIQLAVHLLRCYHPCHPYRRRVCGPHPSIVASFESSIFKSSP